MAAAEADERSFVRNTREYFNSFYGGLLKTGAAGQEKMRWSPALGRAAVALKWGFAVQFSRNQPEGTFIRIQQVNDQTTPTFDKPTAGAGPKLITRLTNLGSDGRFGELPSFRDNRVREPALLGTGTQREIIEAAQRSKLDFVVVAYFYRRGRLVEMSMRVLDVMASEKLYETERVTQAKLANSAEDLGGKIAAVCEVGDCSSDAAENFCPTGSGTLEDSDGKRQRQPCGRTV